MSGRLVCLGCGDAFSALWYSSSLAFESAGRWLLIDCPHPIRKILRESAAPVAGPADLRDIDAVVLTHLHADHASGVEGFAYYNMFVLGRRPVLLAHSLVANELCSRWIAGPTDANAAELLAERFEFHALHEGASTAWGPFEIECRRTCHPIPTFALRIASGGWRVGYSADTAFDPGLIDWLSDCDLIIHETNHGIHTPYEDLARLPEGIRSRMRLIHYPDDFDVAGSVIPVLNQGESVVLG